MFKFLLTKEVKLFLIDILKLVDNLLNRETLKDGLCLATCMIILYFALTLAK